MLLVCKEDQAATSSSISLLISPIVTKKPTCQVPEPKKRIVGENNSCVTGGTVAPGSVPVLQSCTNDWKNQSWTFRSDKTIAYSTTNYCLATYDSTRSPVSLQDCNDKTEIVNWHLTNDGSIVSPQSEHAFQVDKSLWDILAIDNIKYSVSQSWLVTNSISPFLTTIYWAGYEFCLSSDQYGNIRVLNCLPVTAEQKWLIFADRSIRPVLNNASCISCLGNEKGSPVKIRPCEHGSTAQRCVRCFRMMVLSRTSKMGSLLKYK